MAQARDESSAASVATTELQDGVEWLSGGQRRRVEGADLNARSRKL